MSARRKSSASRNRARYIGSVKIYFPDSNGATRVKWVDSFGTSHDTKRGTESEAIELALEVDAQLQRGAGAKGDISIGEAIDDYLSTAKGRNQKDRSGKTDWSRSHHEQVRIRLERGTFLFRSLPCCDVTLALLDKMRSYGGTPQMVEQYTSALRGWLKWGRANRYFTSEQAILLPTRIYMPAPLELSTPAPKRGGGKSARLGSREVKAEDAPSIEQVRSLGDELQKLYPHGRLAVELSAESGVRVAELLQLTADDIDVARSRISVNWQVCDKQTTNNVSRRVPPKHGSVRTAGFQARSQTGFDLQMAVGARVAQAKRERKEGSNPESLLFPHPVGNRLFWYTEWKNDFVKPATLAAGWPYERFEQEYRRLDKKTGKFVTRTRTVTQFDLTWHSLRHRFARTAIDVLGLDPVQLTSVGGWKNVSTVMQRYYRPGQEHLDAALQKFLGH